MFSNKICCVNKKNSFSFPRRLSSAYRELLARLNVQLCQIALEKVLEAAICQGTVPQTHSRDLNSSVRLTLSKL